MKISRIENVIEIGRFKASEWGIDIFSGEA